MIFFGLWMWNKISLFFCQCAKIDKMLKTKVLASTHKQTHTHIQINTIWQRTFIYVIWVDKHGLHLRNVFVSVVVAISIVFIYFHRRSHIKYYFMSVYELYIVFYVRLFGAVHDGFCKPFGRVCFASAHLWWTDKCYYTVKKQLCMCMNVRVYGIKRTSTSDNVRLLSMLILSNANSRNLRHKIEKKETTTK